MVIDLSGGPGEISYPVKYLKDVPAGGWTDTHKTTKLVLRKIPAGTFTMGSPISEAGREPPVHIPNETQHKVTLTQNFYIGVFEVTQRQWNLVMGNNPSREASASASRPVEKVSYYDIREGMENSDDPAVNWPVNSVVTPDSFMGKLRKKTGLSAFDLPTESQWEYACRAGTTTAINNGYNLSNTISDPNLDKVARYSNTSKGGYVKQFFTGCNTAKAGSYLPNAWGLYDMHGNVMEWCLDVSQIERGPKALVDPKGPASSVELSRVAKGGAFFEEAEYCRSASNLPAKPNSRSGYIGFRIAMTLP